MAEAAPLQRRTAVAIAYGVAGAVFFSSTFLVNRWMATGGGSWVWTAALRYGFTVVLLAGWLAMRGQLAPFLRFFRSTWRTWVLWGSVGFGGFYALLSMAAATSPAWLVAGTFQVVLVSGLLLAPVIYRDERRRLHTRALRVASIVVVGALLMQVENVHGGIDARALLGFGLVLLSTVLYPLGNRKILLFLEAHDVRLGAMQMVFGMSLGSVPFWLLVAIAGAPVVGPPEPSQWLGTLAVALLAGIVATGLFYQALAIAGRDATLLGAVEATQSAEVIATVLVEVAILGAPLPSATSAIGIALVVVGIAFYARLD